MTGPDNRSGVVAPGAAADPSAMQPILVSDPGQMFGNVPFSRLIGMRREFSENGKARLSVDARPELGNVVGSMHGGVITTLIDVAMASAAVSRVNFERTAITLNLTTSFLHPGRGTLTADSEVLSHDAQMAWCSAVVTDAEGRVVARGQGSFRYVPLPRPADAAGTVRKEPR
jgi:uncharacterized protein (TIGR00369 family)